MSNTYKFEGRCNTAKSQNGIEYGSDFPSIRRKHICLGYGVQIFSTKWTKFIIVSKPRKTSLEGFRIGEQRKKKYWKEVKKNQCGNLERVAVVLRTFQLHFLFCSYPIFQSSRSRTKYDCIASTLRINKYKGMQLISRKNWNETYLLWLKG